jgi:hypothetical protein
MLNLISILSTFLVAQIVMMSVLNLFLGRIVFLNFNIIKGVSVKHILFFLFNTFILFYFTTFYLPH